MRKLFYVPLESYKERYTCQLSAPKTGWLERNWIKAKVNYQRIDGSLNEVTGNIKNGCVLDAVRRGIHCCSQIQEILQRLQTGEITSEDCIYFDDFWTPGISALPYAFELMGVKPKMYCMLHAQSVDQFDFTYKMRHWMRHFEKGIAAIMDGIFVTSTCLRDLLLYHGVGTKDNVFICGLPYNSEEVREHFPKFPGGYPLPKNHQVIYSSRWDKEKDPEFFMEVMEFAILKRVDVKFVITTSAPELRSNEPRLIRKVKNLASLFPYNIEIRENLTKEEYYWALLESKVQMNTADQDFVSWTLLEATTCGCRPLYPNFLSFPEALQFNNEFMYQKGSVSDAVRMLDRSLKQPKESYAHIYKPFDQSWLRMLEIMTGEDYGTETLYNSNNR